MVRLRFDRELERRLQREVGASLTKRRRETPNLERLSVERIARRPKGLTKRQALDFVLLHQKYNAMALGRVADLLLRLRRRKNG